MDNPKFLCGECGAGYKNESSLCRHINAVHNKRRFVCSICSKEYVRNEDYIKHITRFHHPLILKQDQSNVTYSPVVATTSTRQENPSHSVENTTSLLKGETVWVDISIKDLSLSSDEEDRGPNVPLSTTTLTNVTKVFMGTSTEVHKNPETTTNTNTSP